ncbi:carotenoid cleavage dioxygenase [Nocardia tenerifensis]|uniref:Dioxygenase n=1 Tax=Nocardia tenerifensis TaxID=228006 RepID=A0A318K569_9NOCA|nr:carotenoid oxygenase family protein [Nocardia tenerifensis]PXX58113.1 carotenoid cleavage dioxygenase [Nocardia tenerifensis]
MAADPYLTGAYAPVYTERTELSLPTEGELPEELDGLFTYIGPNPVVPPTGYRARHYAWFRQDGFVSGVRLSGGRADWFRNRWIRDRRVCRAMGEPRPPGPRHFLSDVVHTNVICHGDLLLALVETGCLPARLTPTLDTVEYTPLYSGLSNGVSAHPKLDPNTGELIMIAHTPLHTWGEYLVIDPQARVQRSERIEFGGRPLVHDIALTEQHVIFFDSPVRFQPSIAIRGQLPYRWDRRHQARIGVFRRDDGPRSIQWFEITNCFVLHAVTAASSGDHILLRALRYERMFDHSDDPLAGGGGLLWEWDLDLVTGAVRERQLTDRMQELPRLDPRTVTADSRYYYAITGSSEAIAQRQPTGILKHDLLTDTTVVHDYDRTGGSPTEAVFVPRGAAEDDGWLLHLLYDTERDMSKLIVLDSRDVAAAPIATIDLPCRVPSGFHANWIDGASIEAVDAALTEPSL